MTEGKTCEALLIFSLKLKRVEKLQSVSNPWEETWLDLPGLVAIHMLGGRILVNLLRDLFRHYVLVTSTGKNIFGQGDGTFCTKMKKEDQIYAIMHVVREKVVTLAPGPHATLPSLG